MTSCSIYRAAAWTFRRRSCRCATSRGGSAAFSDGARRDRTPPRGGSPAGERAAIPRGVREYLGRSLRGRSDAGSALPAHRVQSGAGKDAGRSPSRSRPGKFNDEYLSRDVVEIVNEQNRQCIEAGRPMSFESVLDLPAGRSYFHTTLVPIRDRAGASTASSAWRAT